MMVQSGRSSLTKSGTDKLTLTPTSCPVFRANSTHFSAFKLPII